jgi:hypothetical protein
MRSHRGWITFIALEEGRVVGLIAARHLKNRGVPTIRIGGSGWMKMVVKK